MDKSAPPTKKKEKMAYPKTSLSKKKTKRSPKQDGEYISTVSH